MLRRCTASLALLSGRRLIELSAVPLFSAASIVSEMVVNGVDQIVPNGTAGSTNYAYYQLTNPRSTTISDSEGIAIGVVPANSVQPVNAATSPLAIVNGSFGFDPSSLQVFLSPANPSAARPRLLSSTTASPLPPGGHARFQGGAWTRPTPR